MGCNIAIDGPAGAGKSTIARQVLSRLNLLSMELYVTVIQDSA